jgi:fumarate hydratase class I
VDSVVSSQDDEATPNDKFVALELLKNANVAAGRILPGCQDTGTAIIMGKKGQQVRRLLVSTSAPAPS